jgi:hypothetical protein
MEDSLIFNNEPLEDDPIEVVSEDKGETPVER